jgi:hypothetical protein
MAIIQAILIEKMVNHLDGLINSGRIQINGQFQNYTIYKTVKDGNVLRKYLYLETEMGYVEEAQLLSAASEVLAKKPLSISKQEDGIVIAFEFTILVQEG